MRLKVLSSLLPLFVATGQLAAQAPANAQKFSPPARTFHFTYNFTVKDIPSGAKRVRVWVPVPQTDSHQTVRILAVKAPAKTRMTQEPEYGNRMMYAEIENPASAKRSSRSKLRSRAANIRGGDYYATQANRSKPALVSASMTRLVAPDTLIPTDGRSRSWRPR
jgi:hypothetical protein